MPAGNRQFGVYVGRFCPVHLGHEEILKRMVAECGDNCLLIIGSCSHSFSLRHFFSYEERRGFLKKVFPDIRIVGLPDYPTDEEWMLALDDILLVAGVNPSTAVFFGGCEEDIRFFLEFRRSYSIVNRFDGTTPKISATEVRDALIHGRNLEGLLNPLLAKDVSSAFVMKWEKFKKM